MDGAFPGLGTPHQRRRRRGRVAARHGGRPPPARADPVCRSPTCLGLTTLLMAGLSALSVTDTSFASRRRHRRPGPHRPRAACSSGASRDRCWGSRSGSRGSPGAIQERLARRPTLVGAEETAGPPGAGALHRGVAERVAAVLCRPADHPGLAVRRARAAASTSFILESVGGFAAIGLRPRRSASVCCCRPRSVLVVQGAAHPARGDARLRSCRTRTSPPSPPPAASCSSASRCGCYGSGTCRSATCSPPCSSPPLLTQLRGRPAPLSPASGTAGPPARVPSDPSAPPVRRPAGHRTGCSVDVAAEVGRLDRVVAGELARPCPTGRSHRSRGCRRGAPA